MISRRIYTIKSNKNTCIGLSLLKVRSTNLHLFPWVPLLIHITTSSSPGCFEMNFNEPENKRISTERVNLRDICVI